MRRTKRSVAVTIAALVVLGIGTGLMLFLQLRSTPVALREQAWERFQSYAADMQPSGKKPLYANTGTIGCFAHESFYDPSIKDCTFLATYIYQLTGNYRDNGQQFYNFLQRHGYYFEHKDEQQQFEEKLRNTALSDNLSNSEPIIVDLKNKNKTWVRFYLGDKGRTLGPASSEIQGALVNVKDDQLIARISVYRNW